jgi:hypothetical protein
MHKVKSTSIWFVTSGRTGLAAVLGLAMGLAAGKTARADDTYEVRKTDVEATVGTHAKTQVTIAAKKGWHLNAEAPLTLKLSPAQGLTLDKTKLVRADLAQSNETTARFDVGLTATQPGTENVEAEAGFVLCQESACRPVKEKLSIAVKAMQPAAEPKPAPAKKTSKKKQHEKQ